MGFQSLSQMDVYNRIKIYPTKMCIEFAPYLHVKTDN